jgi:hypothetical protein
MNGKIFSVNYVDKRLNRDNSKDIITESGLLSKISQNLISNLDYKLNLIGPPTGDIADYLINGILVKTNGVKICIQGESKTEMQDLTKKLGLPEIPENSFRRIIFLY